MDLKIRAFLLYVLIFVGHSANGFSERQAYILDSVSEFKKGGNYISAIEWLNQLLASNTIDGKDTNIEILVKIQLLGLLIDLERYDQAVEMFHEIEEGFITKADSFLKILYYQEASKLYSQIGMTELALTYNIKAIQISIESRSETDQNVLIGDLYALRATLCNKINDITLALHFSYKAISYRKATLEIPVLLDYYQTIQNDMDSTSLYLSLLDQTLEDPSCQVDIKYQLNLAAGKYWLVESDFVKAVAYLESALIFAEVMQKSELKTDVLQILLSYYKQVGDNEKMSLCLSEILNLKSKADFDLSQNRLSKILFSDTLKDKSINIGGFQSYNLWIGFLIILIVFLFLLAIIAKSRLHKNISNLEYKKLEDEKEILEKKVLDAHNDILESAKSNDPAFLAKFKEVHVEFWKALEGLDANLSIEELKLCAFIRLKFTTKEISSFTYVQVKTVQMKKYRLRKKLGLTTAEDLGTWIDQLVDGKDN
ncbi:hypothetical protein MM236_15265 [Belliella sp. DSM 107340]|uniref:HTH luxR-type domain-containing protein n=1 Tax=Belliella calami TaxID=2923436 RepID=A0ABS9USI3_9BACT|nr:hypothetical protein [Belliella calami]MCH7399360.1 hypothetical protein [Belliella calami]